MSLITKKDERYYPGRDGKLYKSVTTVLKCISPFQGVRQAILDEASDIGKQSHTVVARLCRGEVIDDWYDLPQQVRNAALAYERFRTKVHLYPEQVELELINEEDEYGCTIDHVGTIPKGRVITDWKTGTIHHIAVFQMAAYFVAYIKKYPRKDLIGAFVAQLDKNDGRPHPYFLSAGQLFYYFQGFLAMKKMSDQMDEAQLIINGGETWTQI